MNEQQAKQLEQCLNMLEGTLLPTLKHVNTDNVGLVRGEEVNTRFYARQLTRSLIALLN